MSPEPCVPKGGQGDQMPGCDLLLGRLITVDLGHRCREYCPHDYLDNGETGHSPPFLPTKMYHGLYYVIVPVFTNPILKASETHGRFAGDQIGIWNQRSSLTAVSHISQVASCLGDSEFTKRNFKVNTRRHSLLVLTWNNHTLLFPLWRLANKKTYAHKVAST